MLKIKKLIVALLAATALIFTASICALGAQIDSLSIVDDTVYAQLTDAENGRFFVAGISEGLLVDVKFQDIGNDGLVELEVSETSEYTVYIWDKEDLAPICSPYNIKDGRAYAQGSDTPIPEFQFAPYTFNQEDNVMIVSAITNETITGFKAGEEVSYNLADKVAVLGLSDKIADVVPGSVVLIGTDKAADCAAIELLASLGWPINQDEFKADYGIYDPSDGSKKYQNIVSIMFSKLGSTLKCGTSANNIAYKAESTDTACYRVGIAINGETGEPIISCTNNKVSATDAFESTANYSNYVFLRYNTETERFVECVYYCVPKELNFNPDPDDPYSPIFSLKPIVIIK